MIYQAYIIEIIILIGLVFGILLGITGLIPIGLILVIFDYLNIGEYKKNMGAIMLLNMLPLSIGSFYEFSNTNNVDYKIGLLLFVSIVIGGYFGSKIVLCYNLIISIKQIKYIASFIGLTTFVLFFMSAYYEIH